YKLQDAEKFAKEALKIDPKDPIAFDVLGALRSKSRSTKKDQKKTSGSLVPFIIVLIIAAIVGFTIFYLID
ncbi:MAG: hypothetical protein MRY83_16365, partial [Flavobacteriales bacterium]|nr:hypothetical protein [Flavobacteriales bacterium]